MNSNTGLGIRASTTEAYLKAGLLTDAQIHWALYGRPITGDESTAAGGAA